MFEGGSKRIRIASTILIAIIISMVLAANRGLINLENPFRALTYWALCLGLVMILFALALLDLRIVLRAYLDEKKRALRRLAEGEKEE